MNNFGEYMDSWKNSQIKLYAILTSSGKNYMNNNKSFNKLKYQIDELD